MADRTETEPNRTSSRYLEPVGSYAYESAWYMCMRLRAGMKDPDFKKLMGIVEVDETCIGGKNKESPQERA